MALDFPSSPTNGQVYTDGASGLRYVYNSAYGVWRGNGTSAVIGTANNNQILFNEGGLVRGSDGLFFSNTANVLYINSANVTNLVTTNVVAFNTNSSKEKIRLYDSEIPYAIGMANYMTFGPMRNDWAMTFQMNDDIDRGFWWGDAAHTNAQGAMALTTDGNLYVASKIRLGYGETDTADQETWSYGLDVSGNVNTASSLFVSGSIGAGINSPTSKLHVIGTANITNNLVVSANTLFVDSQNNRVGIGTITPTYRLEVNGSLAAQTKSFVINHPSKSGMKLQYASLEGPENGVYVRGKCKGNKIQLPDYWPDLVDENSITVNLTPIGKSQSLYVKKIEKNIIHIASKSKIKPEFHYTVYGERKDVMKLSVEY